MITATLRTVRGTSRLLVLCVILAVLVVAGTTWFVLSTRLRQPSNQAVDQSNANSVQPAVAFPKYLSTRIGVVVPLPTGMNVCEEQDRLEVRNDACGSATQASFVYRSSAAWDSKDPVMVFDDAFAQELREAGWETVNGHTQTLQSGTVDILSSSLSDALIGAVASSKDHNGRIAIELHRDVPPVIDGQPKDPSGLLASFFSSVTVQDRL